MEQNDTNSTVESFNYLHNQFKDILKTLQNNLKDENSLFQKTVSDLKSFLQHFEESNLQNVAHTPLFRFEPILQFTKNLLEATSSDLLKNNAQEEIIEIISLLFRIAFLQDFEENYIQLALFYNSNVEWLYTNYETGDCNAQIINLRLKIVCSIYKVLIGSQNKNPQSQSLKKLNAILNKLKADSNVKEDMVFTSLVIHGNESINISTLLIVSQHSRYYSTDKIFINIWEKLSCLMNMKVKGTSCTKELVILCYLFDLCFFQDILKDKKNLMKIIFEDENFWKLIQYGLGEHNSIMNKQGMFLLKKATNLLENSNDTFFCQDKQIEDSFDGVWWDSNFKKEFISMYKDLIVVFEFLDEQQVHIVKPVFKLFGEIIKRILKELKNGKNINYNWIVLIHKHALLHESIQIVKWGLDSLLEIDEKFYLNDNMVKSVTVLLISVLNNLNLYYSDGILISCKLATFFNRFTKLNTSKLFFQWLIKAICSLTWSPEALFFVIHALAETSRASAWEESEIIEIRNFVAKVFKTHNKVIRYAVQCEFLTSILSLIDANHVSLESFVLLLSSFHTLDAFRWDSKIWHEVITWMKTVYSKTEANDCLEKYSNLKSSNEKVLVLMFMLFTDLFGVNTDSGSQLECFILKKFLPISVSFKDIEKRLYCDTTLQNEYLIIICHLLEENVNGGRGEQMRLLEFIYPVLKDVLQYILVQMKQITNLKDYDNAVLYLKSFELALKCHWQFSHDCRSVINDYLKKIFTSFETHRNSNNSLPPIRLYCWTLCLKSLLLVTSYDSSEADYRNLVSYLGQTANEPLKKDGIFENTLNCLTLWGKMNSEFLESKWQILQHFIENNDLSDDFRNKEIPFSREYLVNLSSEALNIGGSAVLFPIMSILKELLPRCSSRDIKQMIESIWNRIMEKRKTDVFKSLVDNFIKMLFQNDILAMGKPVEGILLEYTNLIFADSSIFVANVFMKHVQRLDLTDDMRALFSHILASGLLYGPIQKKDDRLTAQVCCHIESFNLCTAVEYNASTEIRARAIQMVLNMNSTRVNCQEFSWDLIQKLLEMERDVTKNKIRYFGDSQVHRVKHRLTQALLLLEPSISSNLEASDYLCDWLCNCLTSENSQPSVKYNQEWLLIRLLIKHPNLHNRFWNHFNGSADIKTKGICSFIAILYHMCKLVPKDSMSFWLDKAFCTILPFCMDQHFELRLHAQVVMEKMWKLAEAQNLPEIKTKYETVNQCILKSIQRGFRGNVGKNCVKLQEDFYLNVFHPLEHYSLKTIYFDLPRLANVGSDEWISTQVFKDCGVGYGSILLESENDELERVESAKWMISKNSVGEDVDAGKEYSNYQKKIIPLKSITHKLNDDFGDVTYCDDSRKEPKDGGLIVVASLIDRAPNLGGLARTCEIFGVSKYVVGSLKYVEDKQFVSLSVTAEKWIPIKEVKPVNLLDYLIEMKSHGYALVGAEQALYSQPLNEVRFPKKSLLLLGNEKEGIPPNMLPLLDICVEIPQIGIIRSLNVHVTGALLIWEYTKQNYFSKKI